MQPIDVFHTLAINGTLLNKTIDILPFPSGSAHTAQMAGLRHWKGSRSGMVREFNSYSTGSSSAIDTQFTIEVISAGIIRLPFFNPGITLNLGSDDTTNKVLTFTDCILSSVSLRYFYQADSIIYSNNWTEGKGYEHFTIHTP